MFASMGLLASNHTSHLQDGPGDDEDKSESHLSLVKMQRHTSLILLLHQIIDVVDCIYKICTSVIWHVMRGTVM